jgi:hypothetical protein
VYKPIHDAGTHRPNLSHFPDLASASCLALCSIKPTVDSIPRLLCGCHGARDYVGGLYSFMQVRMNPCHRRSFIHWSSGHASLALSWGNQFHTKMSTRTSQLSTQLTLAHSICSLSDAFSPSLLSLLLDLREKRPSSPFQSKRKPRWPQKEMQSITYPDDSAAENSPRPP